MNDQKRQCLTFYLLDVMFALPIEVVQEVLQDIRVTKIPRTPDFLDGVMNLRGRIVPVVDLKKKFGLEETPPTPENAVVVVFIPFEGKSLLAGIRVDGVDSVLGFEASALTPPPEIGTLIPLDFLDAMTLVEEKVLLFLNIEKVFTRSELGDVHRAQKNRDAGDRDDA
ncbi:purine-binding chemotaxis protein CheW [Desulfobotulus alkaliphilus]|uniref:Purine-binding chemotaxis protein CheW n=1 Tax=Desulfobotulus alkaliphilus TaxID=622671 RepID=A0A562RQ97_9BACT|nr:chemotaxis protein CheW [Desulfobotulus alkaliphilus]TWI71218.1 purine-binding chemotaxis protein CheW [Desulfobotulus alkaliphilus]